MAPYVRNMNQQITYWAPAGNDGFGGRQLAAPTVIRGRWQNVAVLFRDADGREVTSTAIFYSEVPVEIRGYVALGDQTYTLNPKELAGAYEIRQIGESPNLSATVTLHKGLL